VQTAGLKLFTTAAAPLQFKSRTSTPPSSRIYLCQSTAVWYHPIPIFIPPHLISVPQQVELQLQIRWTFSPCTRFVWILATAPSSFPDLFGFIVVGLLTETRRHVLPTDAALVRKLLCPALKYKIYIGQP
jgi:hypothetical protein